MSRQQRKTQAAAPKPKGPARSKRRADQEHLDALLDEALEETFPASDPVGLTQPLKAQAAVPGAAATARPKFARIWRGRTARKKAEAYQRYWLKHGIALLEGKGATGVQMLREDRETETEFVTISYWESLEAMTGGAKGDPRRTHHLPRDVEFLLELPEHAQILTILESRGGKAHAG